MTSPTNLPPISRLQPQFTKPSGLDDHDDLVQQRRARESASCIPGPICENDNQVFGGLVAPMLARKRGRRPANLPCCPLMSHPDLTLDLTTYLKPTQLTHMGDFHFTRCSINQSLPWGGKHHASLCKSITLQTDWRNNYYVY